MLDIYLTKIKTLRYFEVKGGIPPILHSCKG